MNIEEFYNRIFNLSDKYKNRDLEEYLSALMKIVEENKSKDLTYHLIIEMIENAFDYEIIEFQNEWLKCVMPPDENIISKKFTNPEINEFIDKSNFSHLKPYDFTIEVLKFQIAELHKMKGKQLENQYRYFGIQSESGNYWYNFDPLGNLECGARCMQDNESDFDKLDWSFIGELLENGRIYE